MGEKVMVSLFIHGWQPPCRRLGALIFVTFAFVQSCEDTPGWTNGQGPDCATYVQEAWCEDGAVLQTWTIGEGHNHPEQNCCACGKSAGSPPPPPPPEAEGHAIVKETCDCTGTGCDWRCDWEKTIGCQDVDVLRTPEGDKPYMGVCGETVFHRSESSGDGGSMGGVRSNCAFAEFGGRPAGGDQGDLYNQGVFWGKDYCNSSGGEGGHTTMAGSPSSYIARHPAQCTDDSMTAAVRCCDGFGGGSSPGCKTTTYVAAAEHCGDQGEGWKLCNDEVELHRTKGTGCGFDGKRTWTSTQCGADDAFAKQQLKEACPWMRQSGNSSEHIHAEADRPTLPSGAPCGYTSYTKTELHAYVQTNGHYCCLGLNCKSYISSDTHCLDHTIVPYTPYCIARGFRGVDPHGNLKLDNDDEDVQYMELRPEENHLREFKCKVEKTTRCEALSLTWSVEHECTQYNPDGNHWAGQPGNGNERCSATAVPKDSTCKTFKSCTCDFPTNVETPARECISRKLQEACARA